MKAAQVETLFGEMKEGLVPLVQAIAERKDAVDDALFAQDFDVDKQWDFGIEVVKALGFDFEHGRQDKTAHPFTTSFSPSDVRLTTRLYPDMFKSALFASIHEAGHGMYEQGFDRSFDRTSLSGAASLGVHESQSRMWENIVGRSRGFWNYWLPRLKEYFPRQLEGIGVEAFYQAINRVEPSLIRVEADEVTYNLHIMVRFEIENLMVEGKVKVADLPELWDAKMEEYLGIRPPDIADGVLQDVHWSAGYIGYFPTYSLGNLLAAQFYNQAVTELPGIPAQIEQGEFAPLFNWMRENIHTAGLQVHAHRTGRKGNRRPDPHRAFLELCPGQVHRPLRPVVKAETGTTHPPAGPLAGGCFRKRPRSPRPLSPTRTCAAWTRPFSRISPRSSSSLQTSPIAAAIASTS